LETILKELMCDPLWELCDDTPSHVDTEPLPDIAADIPTDPN